MENRCSTLEVGTIAGPAGAVHLTVELQVLEYQPLAARLDRSAGPVSRL